MKKKKSIMVLEDCNNFIKVVNLVEYLEDPSSDAAIKSCEMVAESFISTGALIVKDPRDNDGINEKFLDMLEAYFGQDDSVLERDARPSLSYQVGFTPAGTEVPRCSRDPACDAYVETLEPGNRPTAISGADPKMRFFWRIGDRPEKTDFPELNAAPVIPDGFPEWQEIMDRRGKSLHAAVQIVSEMLAKGLKLPHLSSFTSLTNLGPHLLAPTGTRLDSPKTATIGTVFAGFHTDLNFITIHGKSRYPGLFIWPRNGPKIQVKVPDGCLLLQAGKQLELLTDGLIRAGFHEVVCTQETLQAIKSRLQNQGGSNNDFVPVRVSSTLFYHIASDNSLAPINGALKHGERLEKETLKAGEQVAKELSFIALGK